MCGVMYKKNVAAVYTKKTSPITGNMGIYKKNPLPLPEEDRILSYLPILVLVSSAVNRSSN